MSEEEFWEELYILLSNGFRWFVATPLIVYLLIVVNILWMEALVNFPKKLKLLQDYETNGIETVGWITSHFNVHEQSKTKLAQYAYKISETKGYQKPHLRIPNCPLPGDALVVLRLPEYAKSGFPKILVTRREQYLTGRYRYKRILFCLTCHVVGLYGLHTVTQLWYPVETLVVLAVFFGYPYSLFTFSQWKKGMLMTVDNLNNKKPPYFQRYHVNGPTIQRDHEDQVPLLQRRNPT